MNCEQIAAATEQGKDLQNTDIQQLFQGCYMQHVEHGEQFPCPNYLHLYQVAVER